MNDDPTTSNAVPHKRSVRGISSDADFPFKVYCLLGGATERKLIRGFARHIEAEVFIHSELLGCANFGTDSGRFWGAGCEGGNRHYWIESPQITASVETET